MAKFLGTRRSGTAGAIIRFDCFDYRRGGDGHQRNGATRLSDYREPRWVELVSLRKFDELGRISNTTFRDYGSTRGYANESEYTVVKVEMDIYFI